ncbi:hypothetical protein MEN41_06105 [Dolichospermum sp. ST_con]|nr:hypothetical protein [Dolichospermum sp. ST_con]MDD1419249.1 hypothetical protein [Dolichospermum sp. ST_sed1]MDD1424745.1 hypothetical protein [Dolichospermum sp. ST_sed9]MDD1434031.1 hypothetical protein [Dolichospermum sp. ST_sed6]MDD1440419.1 hypothetical protein [Dolichospermum sp. ST_sed3]MDD1446439.1 hypothetical protein [Dolichospermum sp. ST_sed8]MDD1456841.1 hypothetical protein [Dolichospermum sp. ST_sed7]MDD1460584.1 hypothetical protein [Dolichospermum sp. ST_sed2]MDD1464404
MGFIKNIIAGIVGFITGLFSKKGNSYYLELKEEATVTPVPATVAPKAEPKTAPVAAKVTKTEPVKPVKIAVPTETNFATKYLIPTNNPRRRPGVNMNTFLDMARQVKTPG